VVKNLIRESLSFVYNGRSSNEFGIYSVNINSGMQEEHFLPSRTIREQKVRGRDEPYFMGIDHDPLQFDLTFAFQDVLTIDKAREVARWLSVPYYAPMVFEANPDTNYYCMPVSDSKWVHNCVGQGYITLTFRCNSPWSYSSVFQSRLIDCSTNTSSGTPYTFANDGNLPLMPQIEVEIASGDGFKIVNTSNGGQYIQFSGLSIGEVLTISCDRRSVDTSLPFTYRYQNMINESKFLEMQVGNNYLLLYGNCKIRFKYQLAFIG
jgi:phage-related protein